MDSAAPVRFETVGEIGIITIDHPPVNALGPGVSEGIIEALNAGNADPAIAAMVLIGAGRSFIAGADIRRFGKPRPRPPIDQRSTEILARSIKPVVAAIHGHALGGGFEHALACAWRIAVPSARIGLPEVLIGVIPGAGGTQRLPRLVGPEAALDIITSGRHLATAEALRLGILDAVLAPEEDLRSAAIAFARRIAATRPIPSIEAHEDRLAAATPAMFAAARARSAKRMRGHLAPLRAIDLIEAACRLPFAEGLAAERTAFEELENSDQAQALRYAFFAEREAARIPTEAAARPVHQAAVIGAGTMGSGIAMCFADAAIPVLVLERDAPALERGMQRIRDTYAVSVKRGSLTEASAAQRIARITPVSEYAAIAQADAVIEAVFEDLPVKQEVFATLDRVMKPGALLLSNTSGIDLDAIASATRRPGSVAGAHFFSPANVMKLLEVVRGDATEPAVLASVLALGKRLGKVAAVAGNCDGFVANRSRGPLTREMVLLLEEGCLPQQIDAAMLEFGYPMGPFAVGDLAGLDIGYAGRQRREAQDPATRKLPIADRLYELGRYGQKTGAGWYRYEPGDRTPHPDPLVARIIAEEAKALGIHHRHFETDEILRRLLFASVNEACRILEEGKAYRASDIDVMWLAGFGFPRWRGGLMFWADTIGAGGILSDIQRWHEEYGPRWAPSPLLVDTAERDGLLRELRVG